MSDLCNVGLWARLNYTALLDILISHPDIQISPEREGCQWTALMFACCHGNSDIVSRLVQMPGLDINYQDGVTAADLASMKGRTECVKILAETGNVDWNKGNKWGVTPLYLALMLGHSDIVDIIVRQPNTSQETFNI